jgi:uncharacterized membrane protein YkoI
LAVTSAIASLIGTIGAIHYSNQIGHLKDVDFSTYKTTAEVQINQAKADAARANENALRVAQDNIKLTGQVSTDATVARAAEAALAKANKETSDFAHSLQQQQATMQEQAKVSPVLTDYQIQNLAAVLAPYKGQDVILHSTADTTVLRLKRTIALALNMAGLTFKQNSIDVGTLYQGVSVAVHDPQDVPPLANALLMGLRQAGIDVHPVAVPQQVPAGQVAIYIGPN